jgi:phosphatidylserine decarboxylase
MIPQHLLTRLLGRLANSTHPALKNALIKGFIHLYGIDMREAVEENPTRYATFNDFFIRQLKPSLRPVVIDPHTILSPADGKIAEIGAITANRLIQAKGHDFTLESLLANDQDLCSSFRAGAFATIYLAPNNYHRYHMPISGKLVKSIYVPGDLFSVNQTTAEHIPDLYSRNERLITVFETEIGQMAMVMVGAMIVGSIQTTWMPEPIKSNTIQVDHFNTRPLLSQGSELGCFKLGSTVILLFEKDKIEWLTEYQTGTPLIFGQKIANLAS